MKKLFSTIICCLICSTAFMQVKPEWQDETIPFVGKEYPRTAFMTYSDVDKARSNDFNTSFDYKSLNGKWKFNWVSSYKKRPVNFYKTDFDDSAWDEICLLYTSDAADEARSPGELGNKRLRKCTLHESSLRILSP